MSKEEYLKFMYDPANIHACDRCPENIGIHETPFGKLPCGQYLCWVTCHIRQYSKEEDPI